jgi:hypothetical protein
MTLDRTHQASALTGPPVSWAMQRHIRQVHPQLPDLTPPDHQQYSSSWALPHTTVRCPALVASGQPTDLLGCSITWLCRQHLSSTNTPLATRTWLQATPTPPCWRRSPTTTAASRCPGSSAPCWPSWGRTSTTAPTQPSTPPPLRSCRVSQHHRAPHPPGAASATCLLGECTGQVGSIEAVAYLQHAVKCSCRQHESNAWRSPVGVVSG